MRVPLPFNKVIYVMEDVDAARWDALAQPFVQQQFCREVLPGLVMRTVHLPEAGYTAVSVQVIHEKV